MAHATDRVGRSRNDARRVGSISEHVELEFASTRIENDLTFARYCDGRQVPHWSGAWPRINAVSRKGLVRVTALSRWMALVRVVP